MNEHDQFRMIPKYRVTARVQMLAETMDYNHQMMNIPAMWKVTKGEGVKLVILDTGMPNHNDLSPNTVVSKSFINNYLEDKNGHSTHCGGIIAAIAGNGMGVAGIAPEVDDIYGAVLDSSGSGSIAQIVAGIYWAVDEVKADIISMSLGIDASSSVIPSLKKACDYAYSKGVTIFAAAGNEAGKVGQPAQYDSVYAVAAVNNKMEHARFSNMGDSVDFAAGGVDVYSTYLNNSYAKLSGTSMATPACAAVAALIFAKHLKDGKRLTPAELGDHLKRIAYDVNGDGFDQIFGFGIPIFQNSDTPDEAPDNGPVEPSEPVTPVQPSPPSGTGKKRGPSANCAYWQMANSFLDATVASLDRGSALDTAIVAGIRTLHIKTKAIDAALGK